MNHFSLLVHLYLLSTQSPQPMQSPQKKSQSSDPQEICLEELHTKNTKHVQKDTKPTKKT